MVRVAFACQQQMSYDNVRLPGGMMKRRSSGWIAGLLTMMLALLVAGTAAAQTTADDPRTFDGATGSVTTQAPPYRVYVPLVRLDQAPNQAPHRPHTPAPVHGATGQPDAITLSWSGGDPDGDAVSYTVYLEPGTATPTRIHGQTTQTFVSASGLQRGVTYYWQIAAVDAHGARTLGPIWSFATQGDSIHDLALEVVKLTNAERAKAGCPALTISPLLVQAAQGHSDDMARHSFFSHTGSDGSRLWDRIQATGYNYSRVAENIAAGYPTPASVVSAWMKSDKGHAENILNCALTEIGVGYAYRADDPQNYRHYWTQDFATPGR
jgi:uncharacterized protein YkwD